MTDYNNEFDAVDKNSGEVNIVVEIPFGSIEKVEWNSETKQMEVDRIEPKLFPEPVNYGFIPKTIGGDGDNLDAFIVSDLPINSGSVIKAKIIGVMKFIDEGKTDDKIVAVQTNTKSLNSISDIGPEKLDKITNYYSHYKDYIQPGLTTVIGWDGIESAQKVLENSINAWQKKN
jgi:inorganic pyrophosphatase